MHIKNPGIYIARVVSDVFVRTPRVFAGYRMRIEVAWTMVREYPRKKGRYGQ
jgi:hypothetical protein